MTESFLSSIAVNSKTKYISIEGLKSGSDITFEIDQDSNGKISERNTAAKIKIPERLMSCTVFGVSEAGSLQLAKTLAQRLLFNIRRSAAYTDILAALIFDDVQAIVICGGPENSDNKMIDEMILTISGSDSFIKNRPLVIFAGNQKAAAFAQLHFSPVADFLFMDKFINDTSIHIDLSVLKKRFIKKGYFNVLSGDSRKNREYSLLDTVLKFSETLCGKYANNVMTSFFSDSFAILSWTERTGGRYFNKVYGISCENRELNSEDFSKIYEDLSADRNVFADLFYEEKDVLPIIKEKKNRFMRPERISGISVCDAFSFEKFLGLVCDPDMLRGAIEFVFDKDGIYLGAGSMFLENGGDFEEWLMEASFCGNFSGGWIIIPDGVFKKDRESVSLHISGHDSEIVNTYFWGKRYFLTVEPFSVIEIHSAGPVLFEGSGKKKVLKTGKSPRIVVIDLRKEKS